MDGWKDQNSREGERERVKGWKEGCKDEGTKLDTNSKLYIILCSTKNTDVLT